MSKTTTTLASLEEEEEEAGGEKGPEGSLGNATTATRAGLLSFMSPGIEAGSPSRTQPAPQHSRRVTFTFTSVAAVGAAAVPRMLCAEHSGVTVLDAMLYRSMPYWPGTGTREKKKPPPLPTTLPARCAVAPLASAKS